MATSVAHERARATMARLHEAEAACGTLARRRHAAVFDSTVSVDAYWSIRNAYERALDDLVFRMADAEAAMAALPGHAPDGRAGGGERAAPGAAGGDGGRREGHGLAEGGCGHEVGPALDGKTTGNVGAAEPWRERRPDPALAGVSR